MKSTNYKSYRIDLAENDDYENYIIYCIVSGRYLADILSEGQPVAYSINDAKDLIDSYIKHGSFKSKKLKNVMSSNEFYKTYLQKWENDEKYSDIKLALDKGYTNYAIYLLDSAGYFEDLDKDVYEEHVASSLKDFNFEDENNELLKEVEIWINPDNNEHAFIPVCGMVDYFVSQKELESDGFKFNIRYNASGVGCHESVLAKKINN